MTPFTRERLTRERARNERLVLAYQPRRRALVEATLRALNAPGDIHRADDRDLLFACDYVDDQPSRWRG